MGKENNQRLNWTSEKLRWMFQFGFFVLSLGCVSSVSGSLSFEIHHRFSDQVKTVLGGKGLPEIGSLDYYKALVHRDRGRHLISNNNETTLSFARGNSIQQISYLHYANVTVGTPAQWFLVALDTGSDVFWLPCNCNSSCVRSMENDEGKRISLNIYDPTMSTTSTKVQCNSTVCRLRNGCLSPLSDCPFRIRYLSPGTRSTGVLVEDLIHMRTEEGEDRNARITFGCSDTHPGFEDVATNGLMGLSISDISVPNMLVKAGIASDSFSMCFGPNGKGTISFGDQGSSDQLETPLSGTLSPPFYDVHITKFKVGNETMESEFSAIFDSGTAVTWLIEPYYTSLTTKFHSSITDKRLPAQVEESPFEFCYIVTSATKEDKIPSISLEMQGGAAYDIFSPILVFDTSNGGQVYCLAVLKQRNADFNIIGQNFMSNYRIVHDRERMILGWKQSDCNDKNGYNGAIGIAKPPSLPPSSSPRFRSPAIRLNPLVASSFVVLCFISFLCL